MTVKEVEKLLEIPRATIRFYEKEELIRPERGNNSYREYSEEDVATLKKIIIFRKLGMSVSDIKAFLEGDAPLQELLTKNISELQEKMKELEGAINVCKLMQEKNEDMETFDENYYWDEIHTEEKAGNKFLELVNDVMEFEKKVILSEFQLINKDGELIYGKKGSFIQALGACLLCGVLWCLLDGTTDSFVEGFFWPFLCILLSSVIGLPLHFIGKKNPKLANTLMKIIFVIGVVFVVEIVLAAISMAIFGSAE